MKIGSGAVLIVFALFVLYIGVSGKYDCFSGFFSCLFPGRQLQLGGAGVAPGSASTGSVFGGVKAGGSAGPSVGISFPIPGAGGSTGSSGGCFLPGCGSFFGGDFGDLGTITF